MPSAPFQATIRRCMIVSCIHRCVFLRIAASAASKASHTFLSVTRLYMGSKTSPLECDCSRLLRCRAFHPTWVARSPRPTFSPISLCARHDSLWAVSRVISLDIANRIRWAPRNLTSCQTRRPPRPLGVDRLRRPSSAPRSCRPRRRWTCVSSSICAPHPTSRTMQPSSLSCL